GADNRPVQRPAPGHGDCDGWIRHATHLGQPRMIDEFTTLHKSVRYIAVVTSSPSVVVSVGAVGAAAQAGAAGVTVAAGVIAPGAVWYCPTPSAGPAPGVAAVAATARAGVTTVALAGAKVVSAEAVGATGFTPPAGVMIKVGVVAP